MLSMLYALYTLLRCSIRLGYTLYTLFGWASEGSHAHSKALIEKKDFIGALKRAAPTQREFFRKL